MKCKEILEGWTDHGDYVRPKRRSVDPDEWKRDRDRDDDLPPIKRYEPSDAEKEAEREYQREKAAKLAAVMAMQDRMYSKIYGKKKKDVDENVPTTTGPAPEGKIKQISGGEVEIENPDGTSTKAPADRLIKDPTTGQTQLAKPANTPGQPNNPADPRSQQNTPQPGEKIKIAAEDLAMIKKLAGL